MRYLRPTRGTKAALLVFSAAAALSSCSNKDAKDEDRREAAAAPGNSGSASSIESTAKKSDLAFNLAIPDDVRAALGDVEMADKDADAVASSLQKQMPDGLYKMISVDCAGGAKPGKVFGFVHLVVQPTSMRSVSAPQKDVVDDVTMASAAEEGPAMAQDAPAVAASTASSEESATMSAASLTEFSAAASTQPGVFVPLRCAKDLMVGLRWLKPQVEYELVGHFFSIAQHLKYQGSAIFTYPASKSVELRMDAANDNGLQIVKVIFGNDQSPPPPLHACTQRHVMSADQSKNVVDDCRPTEVEIPDPAPVPAPVMPKTPICSDIARLVCVKNPNGTFSKRPVTASGPHCEMQSYPNEVAMVSCDGSGENGSVSCSHVAMLICVKKPDGSFAKESRSRTGPNCALPEAPNQVDMGRCAEKAMPPSK